MFSSPEWNFSALQTNLINEFVKRWKIVESSSRSSARFFQRHQRAISLLFDVESSRTDKFSWMQSRVCFKNFEMRWPFFLVNSIEKICNFQWYGERERERERERWHCIGKLQTKSVYKILAIVETNTQYIILIRISLAYSFIRIDLTFCSIASSYIMNNTLENDVLALGAVTRTRWTICERSAHRQLLKPIAWSIFPLDLLQSSKRFTVRRGKVHGYANKFA